MLILLYLLAAIAIIVCYWVYVTRRNVRAHEQRRSIFIARENVPQNEWFRRYFSSSGIDESTAVAIFEPIARGVGCALTQLRPDDAFNSSLAFKGIAFLGIHDGDDLSDYAEYNLPLAVGGQSISNQIIEQLGSNPSLFEIAIAVVATMKGRVAVAISS